MHFAEEDHRLQGIKYIPREMQGNLPGAGAAGVGI